MRKNIVKCVFKCVSVVNNVMFNEKYFFFKSIFVQFDYLKVVTFTDFKLCKAYILKKLNKSELILLEDTFAFIHKTWRFNES